MTFIGGGGPFICCWDREMLVRLAIAFYIVTLGLVSCGYDFLCLLFGANGPAVTWSVIPDDHRINRATTDLVCFQFHDGLHFFCHFYSICPN